MKQNDFYEVNGCTEFIPVTINERYNDGVDVTIHGPIRPFRTTVEQVYQFQKPHEPQKVVVPKFVAEWIDTLDEHGLFGLNYDVVDESVWNWVYKNYDCNVKKLHLAYLYGYEIEREKLYTVEIPDPNRPDTVTFLYKENGKVFIGSDIFLDEVPNYKWKKEPENQLTEAEIKQDFEWAWDAKFAKEVE